MSEVSAELVITTEDADSIVRSIEPDNRDSKRFRVKLNSSNNQIKINVDADDVSALQAAINSYLRLIRTTMEL